MCAWAERVHASVRTPGGRTGIREPGTPVGPGVSARVAHARPPVSVKECAPPLLTCQGVRPAVSLYVLRAACPRARCQWVQTLKLVVETYLLRVQTLKLMVETYSISAQPA